MLTINDQRTNQLVKDLIDSFIKFADGGIIDDVEVFDDSFLLVFSKNDYKALIDNIGLLEMSIPKSCLSILDFDICKETQ